MADSDLSEATIASRNDEAAKQGSRTSAKVTDQGINSIVVDVRSAGPAWLLVGANDAPGWTADIDGVSVPIVRANHNHMAVPIDGPGRVEFHYRPPGLLSGLVITLVALALCAGLLVAERARRRLMA